MPIQDFNIYTANGYAGDLVDSGPRVIQSGVLTTASAGFGVAMQRDATVEKGCKLGSVTGNVYAISQREYNHEAENRPSDGETLYHVTESVSLIRQGYLYVKLTGATAIAEGEVLHVNDVTGAFTKTAVTGDVVACTNVVADEAGIEGDVIKVRIDIVA